MNDSQPIVFAHTLVSLSRQVSGLATILATLAFAPSLGAAEGGWRDFFLPGNEAAEADESPADNQLLLNDPLAGEPATDETDEDWMVSSPFGHVSWPEIKLPKFEFRAPWKSTEDGKPGWLAAPLFKVRDASHAAMDRTRTAWNSTVDRMKFVLPGGDDGSVDTTPQLAEHKKPGFWQRLLASPEPQAESEGVVDLMAQEPTNPTR